MDLFDLVAKISLDSSEYEKGLGDAGEKAKGLGDKLKTGLKAGGIALGAITTATVGLSTALVKSTSDVASYGDNIDKMSQKMGLSIEAYQEWDAIMQHSGASIDSMQRGMTTLSAAVENGSDAFAALGISLEDASSMSQEELFSATITALQNMESGTERTVLAQKLLGGSAKELGALLNTSAEDTEKMRQRVHELGGVMSEEAVKSAAAYQDSLQDMQTAFSGLSRGLVTDFLPGITTVMDGLTEIFSGDGETGLAMISSGIDGLMAQITEKLPEFINVGLGIIESLANAIIENIPELAGSAIEIISSLVMNIIDNLPKLIDAAVQIIFALTDGIINAIPQLIPAIVAVVLTIVSKLTEPNTIMQLIAAAFEIINAVAQGLISAIPVIIRTMPTIMLNIIEGILRFLPQILTSGVQLVSELAIGIIRGGAEVINGFVQLFNNVGDLINERVQNAKQWGIDLIANFINGIVARAQALWNTLKDIGQGVRDLIGFSEPKEGPLSNFHTYAPDMMKLFAKGIKDNEHLVTDQLEKSFDFEGDITANSRVNGTAKANGGTSDGIINIVVQSVLDGKVIGETAYKYQRGKARAMG